jgi:[protein-PII] uridylyltransferase
MLARVALILYRNDIRLHRAKINTLGSRAEDVFWISGEALSQPEQTGALKNALLSV